jgi:hypothetical protein
VSNQEEFCLPDEIIHPSKLSIAVTKFHAGDIVDDPTFYTGMPKESILSILVLETAKTFRVPHFFTESRSCPRTGNKTSLNHQVWGKTVYPKIKNNEPIFLFGTFN